MQRGERPSDVSRAGLNHWHVAVKPSPAMMPFAEMPRTITGRPLGNNVLKGAILVQESISPKIAYDHSLLAYTYKRGLARFVPIIQSRKAPIAINESVRKLGRIAWQDGVADNHAVIVEPTRVVLLCSGK